jgi:hypothetical protein
MEPDQKVMTQFLCKEGVSAEDIEARFEAQFGEDTYSLQGV